MKTKDKVKSTCNVCRQEKEVRPAILRVFSTKWEEIQVLACSECFNLEEMTEAKEAKEAKAA